MRGASASRAMPRRPSGHAERPPAAPGGGNRDLGSTTAFDVKAPFAANSVGSIVRPGTSPVVGLYANQGRAPSGGRFFSSAAKTQQSRMSVHDQTSHQHNDDDDDDGVGEVGGEPASTRLLRRNSHSHGRRPTALGQRPSTSGGQGSGALDCVPLQRSASLGRVPPVPPRNETLRAIQNELPDEMVVEGQHTGEEVRGTQTEVKEKRDSVSSRRGFFGTKKEEQQNQRDHSEIQRLRKEVRRLQGVVDKQNKELQELRNADHSADQQLNDELRQARQRVQALEREMREGEERREWQESRHQRQNDDLEQMLREERARNATLRGDAEDRQVEARIKCRELEDRVEANSRERDDLRRRMQEQEDEIRRMRDQALGEKLATEAKDRDINDLRNQQRSRESMICQLKAALAEDASTVERLRNELREARDEHVQKEAELIERRRKAEQFQEYVLKICQPHFAVVKDESLCPVNVSGFQVTEGHVLVPLILLLEGYALLPPQLKSVIDAKSSKLAKGIDYGARTTDITTESCNNSRSYKDRLYSMMDEQKTERRESSTHQAPSRGRGFFSSSSSIGMADKLGNQRPRGGTSSSGGCWRMSSHANGGKEAHH